MLLLCGRCVFVIAYTLCAAMPCYFHHCILQHCKAWLLLCHEANGWSENLGFLLLYRAEIL